MKLKCIPEDFQVEELTSVAPDQGSFALYRLVKESMGTPEAIAAVISRFNVHRRQVSYGGLKDKHARTLQYLTIHRGPRRSISQTSLSLEYLGQTNRAYTSADINGNRFTVVLRDMKPDATEFAQRAVHDIAQCGLPNYFDDQRFGSLGESGEWIGKSWCLGDYERALWLALADPVEHDSSAEKREKQILRDLWGQWPDCKRALSRSHRRSVITFLSDKVESGRDPDYRGAFARISVDLRGLYLSAFQSALWNRLLTRCTTATIPEGALLPFRLLSGPGVFPAGISDDQATALGELKLPLPSARIDLPEGETGRWLSEILEEEKLELRRIRVKYPRDSFFSRGERAAFVSPGAIKHDVAPDELYPGRQRMTLEFELPRGCYATILVKRLTIPEACSNETPAS